MARRAELRRIREQAGSQPAYGDPDNKVRAPHPEKNSQQPTDNNQSSTVVGEYLSLAELAEVVDRLPDHLGWGSATQTAVLRAYARRMRSQDMRAQERVQDEENRGTGSNGIFTPQPAPIGDEPAPEAPEVTDSGTVSLAPSLGLAILRHKQAPAARLWLLLRHLDKDGRGVLPLQLVREAFTAEASPLRFCGPRRLRGLLAAGSDRFWTNDGERIWLRSTIRVAGALGVKQFKGQAVAIPAAALTGGIGGVRAHLFSAFHSGRDPAPIARQTLARISGVAPRTQRHYDQISGAGKQTNYACGPRLDSAVAETMAWQQGPAAFAWTDTDHGRQRFLAWQLPNSYNGPHAQLGRGGRKRQNKALADLLNKGTAGNDHSQYDDLAARYFADARAASRAHGRTNSAVYWPAIKPGIWHCLWLPGNEGTANRSKSSAGGRQK